MSDSIGGNENSFFPINSIHFTKKKNPEITVKPCKWWQTSSMVLEAPVQESHQRDSDLAIVLTSNRMSFCETCVQVNSSSLTYFLSLGLLSNL